MSNIKKIRQEIERRLKYESENYHDRKADGRPNEGWAESLAIMGELEELLSFIDSLPEEKLSEDLEEAAEKYADKHGFRVPYDGSINYYDDVDVKASKEGFIAGAEWQKSQMLEDAAEAKIYGYDDGSFELIASWLDIPNNSIYKDGDKVKIIIVKQ